MSNIIFTVDENACIRCGACAEVCPGHVISREDGIPVLAAAEGCISCGHCGAVCPVSAIDHSGNPLQRQPLAGEPFSREEAERFLRYRRSIRTFVSEEEEELDLDLVQELLRIARYAQTAGNTQGVSFITYINYELLDEIRGHVVDFLEQKAREGGMFARYRGMTALYRNKGVDVILRGAPALIVAHGREDFPVARDNARFYLTYAELMAPSLGLGTCWAGFVELCAQAGYRPLLDTLKLPEGQVCCAAAMVGIPKYRYHRLVDKGKLNSVFR